MKKNIAMVILGLVITVILSLIIYTIFIKDKTDIKTFNYKEGQVLNFKDFDLDVKILNIAEIKCLKGDKKCKEQIEVLLSVDYDNKISYYHLKSIEYKQSLIQDSNYYVILDYDDNKISIDIKDKKEVNKTK